MKETLSVLAQLIQNRILVAAVSGWFVAQVLKAIIHTILTRSFSAERLVGDGGMPSAHSATVSALTAACGYTYGLSSPFFGISAILAIIIMHDAMGVRRETGKQARILNVLIDSFQAEHGHEFEETLKIFVGHTPLQVTVGCILGIAIGIFICTLY